MEDEPPSIHLFFTEDSTSDIKEINLTELEKSTQALIKLANHSKSYEAGIKIVDGPTMSQLHNDYMQDPTETDVMSFESDEEDLEQGYLGDVIICSKVAEEEAQNRSHSKVDEMMFYILHGLLHLLGYDDDTPKKRLIMLNIQAEAMKSIGRTIQI